MEMKKSFLQSTLTAFFLMTVLLTGCHPIEEFENNNVGNFEALWAVIDQHYCFLDEKGVDWDAVYEKYKPQVNSTLGRQDLFIILADMLDELKDGHVNLSAPFETSYYRKWWSDYPQNFDQRIIEQYYFNFDYRSVGSVFYGWLPQGIGYIRYPSFSASLGAGNIDYILSYFSKAPALIIDIRDNGGGEVLAADDLIGRFISERTLAGYICHKTGPGHNDFSDPNPIYIDTPKGGHLLWNKPVVVLTNRSTFSAANYFTMVMKNLPQVTVIGATTGGGCGMPFSSELPNGWGVRFSACPVYDVNGVCTEFGVEPSEGCQVDMDPVAAFYGHDTILDFAVDYLTGKVSL